MSAIIPLLSGHQTSVGFVQDQCEERFGITQTRESLLLCKLIEAVLVHAQLTICQQPDEDVVIEGRRQYGHYVNYTYAR